MAERQENITPFQPRQYQLEILNYLRDRNGIVYLPTGSGKTFIAILALKHFSSKLEQTIENGGKRAIFMCNTVELARQQYGALKKNTNLKIGLYVGDRDVDNWCRRKWYEELEHNQVLVGTAQIFLDIVNQNIIKVTDLSIVIIDECHHATGRHPMHNFLSTFQYCDQTKLPRVIGLTGVLIKGNKTDIVQELQNLEATFRGNIVTICDLEKMKNVMIHSTKPTEELIVFEQKFHKFRVEVEIKNILEESKKTIDNVDIGKVALKMSKNLGNIREPNKKNAIKNLLSDFEYQMDDFGLYTASLAILAVIIEFEIKKRQAETIALRNLYRYVIQCCERIRHIIVKELLSFLDDDNMEHAENETDDRIHSLKIIENYSTPKMRSLFKYMKKSFSGKQANELACLIFVDRRNTAKCLFYAIKNYISHIPQLKNVIRPQFMVGRSNIPYSVESILDSKWNSSVVNDFCKKEFNVIICSSVLEEGIDIQACNYVFVLDKFKSFNSYIQTKGRARSEKSLYVIFAEESEQKELLQKIQMYRQIHNKIKDFLLGRTLDRDNPNEDDVAKQFAEFIPPYVISSGARLVATSALPTLHRYCVSLPWDSFGASQPWYTKLPPNKEGKIAVSLVLPLQSSIKETIVSDYFRTAKEAKISAAFKACVKLYENGELNKFLQPFTKFECIANLSGHLFQHWKKYDDDVTKLSVGKQFKRIHEREFPRELTNSLPRVGEKAYVYKITFLTEFEVDTYNEHIVKYMSSKKTYGILLSKNLPKLAQMPLFMSQGKLHVKISEIPIECVINSEEQLNELIRFHTMIFRDILQLWKAFLVVDRRNQENSFIIVALDENQTIDWELIRKFQYLDPCRTYTIAERQIARYYPQDYLNKVVTKWYNEFQNECFIVTKVHEDLTPMSKFDTIQYSTYAEFYSTRYNIKIQQSNQFLLEVKSLTYRRNFFNNASNKSFEKRKTQNKVILVPELCHNYKYPGDLWLKALFLPTILHRVFYMLHAESLRITINKFLNLDQYFTNYTPKPLIIDVSLKRALDEDGNLVKEKAHPKTVLLSLPTKKQVLDHKINRLDQDDVLWKNHLEPIDLPRNISETYSVEIDYYHKFIMKLLPEIENLKISDDLEYSKSQLDMPTTFCSITKEYDDLLNIKRNPAIKCSTDPENIEIEMLKRNFEPDHCLKSAEQYEFLAAITAAKVNDVFDMERFELLGDAFLKLSTSLYLANNYTSWHEGFLTIIKGRMVSNRNLLYCMKDRNLCQILCTSLFNPNAGWLPPLSSLPVNILKLLKHHLPPTSILSPSEFYGLQLNEEEIFGGICSEDKLEPFAQACINFKKLADGNVDIDVDNDMNVYINKVVFHDKVASDALEALLGVCVKNYGINRSFKMLQFFGICNAENTSSHFNLLDLQLNGRQLRTDISEREVDAFLINYKYLEKNLGYSFRQRAFLLQALTHPSYPTNRLTGCYQELEFLGDAILDMLITCYIFERFQNMTPGKITDLRMALVNNTTLGCICIRHKFHLFLLSENSALSESIKTFARFQETQNYQVTDQVRILMEEHNSSIINPFNDILNCSNEESDNSEDDNITILSDMDNHDETNPCNKKSYNIAQNVDVPKVLGDIVEALIAAVYLDCRDLSTTWKVIYNLMKTEIVEFSNNIPIDAVRKLQENHQAKPKYSVPVVDNNDVMVKCVFNCLDNTFTTNGFGSSAKQAKKAAAKQALTILAKHSN